MASKSKPRRFASSARTTLIGATNGQRVEHHLLDRGTLLVLGQVGPEDAALELLGIAIEEHVDVAREIRDDDPVADLGVYRDRHHGRRAETFVGEALRHVDAELAAERLQHRRHVAADPLAERIAPELRLGRLQETRQADRALDIPQRIVRRVLADAVRGTQAFQAKGHHAVLARPLDAVGPQCACRAHQVDQVPARVALLPLAGVGVHQVAVEAEAQEVVVEAQVVVADHAGPGFAHAPVHLGECLPTRRHPRRSRAAG